MRSTIALCALAVLALAQPCVSRAAPLADLKAATAAALKAQKEFDKQRIAACSAAIGVVTEQVRLSLLTAPAGLESVANTADDCIFDVLNKAVLARAEVMQKTQAIIATDGVGTPGFLVGDGGALDQFQTKNNAELEKSRKQIEKRLRAYAAAVLKITNGTFRQTVLVPALRNDIGPAPNKPPLDTVFEDRVYPSRLLLGIAGSNANVGNDGKVCVSGRAYLNIGIPNVNVQLFHTSMPPPKLNVAIEGGTGRWRTCFVNIPLGNYHIWIDQDPNHDTVFGETAAEYSTIGVP